MIVYINAKKMVVHCQKKNIKTIRKDENNYIRRILTQVRDYLSYHLTTFA